MGQVVLEFPQKGWVKWKIKGKSEKDILKTLKEFKSLMLKK